MKYRIHRTWCIVILIAGLFLIESGCAYYNYYYNARKNYEDAEKRRRDTSNPGQKKNPATGSIYSKSITSAERMIEYYPGSEWEDDAILLIAKASYRDGKYRSAAGRADELMQRFPESPLNEEASLYKGLSLLRLAQPDSARQILGDIFLNSTNKGYIALGHYGLGEFYLAEKRPEAALPEFRAAAQAAEDDIWLRGESWVMAGETLGLLEKFEEAVELYDEILAQKIPRRLRFQASLQRASALRQSGNAEEAYRACRLLLKDGAFAEDFPAVELEAAKSVMETGNYNDAREILEELVESEKRGEIGAEAHYHLGLIHWISARNDSAALAEFQAVKSTERSAKIVPFADSLAAEIEALVKYHKRLKFLERQFTQIDSANQGLKQLFLADTLWVDSTAVKQEKAEKSKDRSPKNKGRDFKGKGKRPLEGDPNDPIRKMVEEAMAADPTGNGNLIDSANTQEKAVGIDTNSVKSAPADSIRLPLDSTQLASIESLFRKQQQIEWIGLVELHLFDRQDLDSSRTYIDLLLDSDPDSLIWARGMASKAYIAKSRGDTTAYDSLYRMILERAPDEVWKIRSERALNMEIKPPLSTRSAALVDSAESIWLTQNDAETARLLYLLAAEVADSGDTAAAKGLLAAAYISRTVLGQDSLANKLYAEISSKFPNSSFSKVARKKSSSSSGPKVETPHEFTPVERDFNDFEDEMVPGQSSISDIFEVDKIDEPPRKLTTIDVLNDYLRSYYPFEAYGERLNGKVELTFVVRANGEVTDVQLGKTDPEGFGFEDAAIQVIELLEYRPGRNKGQPVNVRMKETFNFKFPADR